MRTLIRKRAEIQNDEGRFPPTDPGVARERKVKESVIWRHYAGNQEVLQKFKEAGFFSEAEK